MSARRVLCVDDYPDVAESLAMLLALLGYEARACRDPFAGLEEARRFRPDVCLLDLDMPGLTGCQLARAIRRELGPRVRLIAVTGRLITDEADRQITEAGFTTHFTKPADPESLLAVLGE